MNMYNKSNKIIDKNIIKCLQFLRYIIVPKGSANNN